MTTQLVPPTRTTSPMADATAFPAAAVVAVAEPDVTNTNKVLNLWEEFVISNGGEYFFSPSINALANVLSV